MPRTTANRGTVLNDDAPVMVDDTRNLRINQPHRWREILRNKRGVKLPEDDTLPNRRKTVTRKNEVEWTFDPTEERHATRQVRDPKTKEVVQEAGSAKWKEHIERVNKNRGYDKPRVKAAPEPVGAEKKPTPKRKTRRVKKGGAK